MKRPVKTALIIALILILGGALGGAGIMGKNGWTPETFTSEELETETVEAAGAFRNISVACKTEDVIFVSAPDGACRVELFKRKGAEYAVSVENGTLIIEAYAGDRLFDLFGSLFGNPKITVYLPETAYGTLAVKATTGDVRVPADFTFESAKITASTGSVLYGASASGAVGAETTTGDIRIDGISCGKLALSASTGTVTLNDVSCAGKTEFHVTTGDTFATGITCTDFASEGSTGETVLKGVTAEETFSVRRSTGDIRLEGCDAAELDIGTGTGDVSGSLLTEKIFIAKSGTGSVSVPETVTGGICRIATSTGDIKITVG